jgi:hypothetical protein
MVLTCFVGICWFLCSVAHSRPHTVGPVAIQSKEHRDILDIIDNLCSKGISWYVELPRSSSVANNQVTSEDRNKIGHYSSLC